MAQPESNQDPFINFLVDRHQQKLTEIQQPELDTIQIEIGNDVETKSRNRFKWTVYVRPSVDGIINRVCFELHSTFMPNKIYQDNAPFKLERIGWGEFDIKIGIQIKGKGNQNFVFIHPLTLGGPSSTTHSINLKPGAQTFPRMVGVSKNGMHGVMGNENWPAPFRVVECSDEARPGYNSMSAHEYEEDPRTLQEKVKLFCQLLRRSNMAMAYTGAGISTASGINDYASKAKNSKIYEGRSKLGGYSAEPSLGHRVLTGLFNANLMKHWVQQNHDGLPQKAGFPQWEINEIHGSWFDCSNPVIPMEGTLRDDLSEWMEQAIENADLTIAMGTSLCGMNADRCVESVAKRCIKHGKGSGAIIVGLQQTAYDEICSLRIYAKIDEVMALVANELNLTIPVWKGYEPSIPQNAIVGPDIYKIPYNSEGKLTANKNEWICWNLNANQKMRVVSGPGEGFLGTIVGRSKLQGCSSHYHFISKTIREGSRSHGKGEGHFYIGAWWVETAVKGKWHQIPIINVAPRMQRDL